MGRPHFQHHLVLLPEVEGVDDLAAAQVPYMHPMAIFGLHQQIRLQTVFDHLRGAPFRADEGVMEQVPPEVVAQVLVTSIDIPFPKHVKAKVIEQENATRSVARWGPERADVDSLRAAMHGMWP